MNSFEECDQFRDHRRAICRGERTDLTLETINRYRALWGFAPIHQRTEAVTQLQLQGTATSEMPPVAVRVAKFAGSLVSHIADGLAKCSEEEISRRLGICKGCVEFTGTHCRKCGCACSGQSQFMNKLAWRSESCPLGKWDSIH